MGNIDTRSREILLKIVFYGVGRCGKTTTLKSIHDMTPTSRRSGMVSLATQTDRTLYFDYLPVSVSRVGKYEVRLQLYTVPGQVFYRATRKIVLRGADGVVFVADSQRSMRDGNLVSLDDLNENLAEQHLSFEDMPLVFQYNKRDLSDIFSVEEMEGYLNYLGAPSISTVALRGEGLREVLTEITKLTVRNFVAKNMPST